MKIFKQLPLTMAVIAALCPISVFAQGTTQTAAQTITPEQLNQIVAQAVEKALAERQEKIDATLVQKKNVDVVDTSAIKPSPETEIPYGLKFNAYARYGAHFQAGDQKYIGVDGSYNGSSAIGRLGNEGNGGEFQLSKAFKGNNGALWDVVVMLDHWGDEVNLKKAYAGVTNLFESQPNAYLWAGRDFHQRPQQGINDYFWMTHDGQGAGIKNLDLGVLQLDAAAVGSVQSCSPQVVADQSNPSRITCTGGSGTGDNGHYALTSKIHGVKFGPVNFELYTNYGFDSKAIESEEKLKAWQTAVVLSHTGQNIENKWVTRYSDNSDNSVYNKTSDLRTVYTSVEGTYKFTPQTSVTYLAAFHDYDRSNHSEDNRRNYGVIIRPMHFWNDVHSTWLEAGYQRVDYDTGGDNRGWKLTLSQNVSIDMGADFRPMLRFYVTGGEVDNKHTATTTDTEDTRLDSFNIGAMWEAWF
ncbi:carbohydrate porin [Yersinia vastinensis]|uniref:carbohydrate porin n=1 Tax=Yersinia vastinensis TaxID=2890318 RepID=UPI0005E4B834|nr:carbohydrate porin [Yersinia vastinensis]OVZ98863.1 carbohydrate porin [Yersinia frederiksenii]CNH78682.1 maltoporin [Yersinia frederiksenii]CNI65326.1 maltoporin [Yersinia frederiksenii]CNJ96000.1 maltoporin [Yersinia frederiksenii]